MEKRRRVKENVIDKERDGETLLRAAIVCSIGVEMS